MKQTTIIFLLSVSAITLKAQDPIHWNWTINKTGDKVYEVKLTAIIDNGWHLYAQTQPADAINLPTTISFTRNPILTFQGNTIEVGKLENFKDKELGIAARQYSDKVEFVQIVRLKSVAKTKVTGTIQYQACTNKKCLPPKTIQFNIQLVP